ncbi:MAG TPA: DUF2971 domain-containing protein [Gallionella sp.]|nr:DUF2971 domain-containing protein [Gallionella sp.]
MRSTDQLHKYMGVEGAIRFFNTMGLRFTQPDQLNDPYECHLAFDKKVREQLVEDFVSHTVKSKPDGDLKRISDMAERNADSLLEMALENYKETKNQLGVLSLSEDPLNLLMWAHYADKHQGVVIELDFTHESLFKVVGGGRMFSTLSSVRYQNEKVVGVPTPDKVIESLLVKSLDWEYEKEWRFIRTLNLLEEVEDGIFVGKISPKAIKRVIFGSRFPEEKLAEITKFTKLPEFSHVKLEKALMIPNRFELRTIELGKFAWTLLHREHHFGNVAREALLCVVMEEDEEQS